MMPTDKLSLLEQSYDAGYMSVYAFDAQAADEIAKSGSSKGFARYPVYSDTIYIDLDTGTDYLQSTMGLLMDKGLGFDVFFSGCKGYHIAIPLDKIYKGTEVPYSQLKWIESMGIEGFDPSIYKASALISLPGRKHPNTGVRKYRLNRVTGNAANLRLVEPPKPVFNKLDLGNEDALRVGVAQLSMLTENPPAEGNRHNAIWRTAKSLFDAGVEFDSALDLLSHINDSWDNPKDEEDVKRAVKGAYE